MLMGIVQEWPMKAVKWSAALLLLLLAMGACTTTGFGVGEMSGGDGAGE